MPDPNQAKTHNNGAVCTAVNSKIEKDLLGNQCEKRKRRSYHRYAPELRVKIARYANEHGLKATTKHFAVELGHEIRHSTIQGMQK